MIMFYHHWTLVIIDSWKIDTAMQNENYAKETE